jgi:hypothetical protein
MGAGTGVGVAVDPCFGRRTLVPLGTLDSEYCSYGSAAAAAAAAAATSDDDTSKEFRPIANGECGAMCELYFVVVIIFT